MNSTNIPLIANEIAWSAMLIGGFLNVTSIWLISRHTSKEMRVYSRIFLQTCLSDFTNLLLFFVGQQV